MRNSFCNLLMSNENTLPEPVECLMHAQDYLSKTRGEVSARKSMAWWILQRDVVRGGKLELELGPQPNEAWAANAPLPK